jgi:hypothetical protein
MVTLSGGLVPNSAIQSSLGAGSYSFQAAYSGDSNYASSTSPCENFTVTSNSVGGIALPIDKVALLAPYIGFALVLVFATTLGTLYLRRVKSKREGDD